VDQPVESDNWTDQRHPVAISTGLVSAGDGRFWREADIHEFDIPKVGGDATALRNQLAMEIASMRVPGTSGPYL